MPRTIYRYEVPVDDKVHVFSMTGSALPGIQSHVEWDGTIPIHLVEFWAEHWGMSATPTQHAFQVFGTGHEVPEAARYIGTARREASGLVWHLYEVRLP